MPAKKRIFREDILAASVNVIRKWGPDGLSVRHIAQALGASTQPIYSEFHSLEALKAALLDHVREKFLRFRSTNYKDFARHFCTFPRPNLSFSSLCTCASGTRGKSSWTM